MSLFRELVRRNVFRVGVAYLAAGWVTLEACSLVFDIFGAPGWVLKVMITLLAIGFPIALGFSWAYEITPEGLMKTSQVDRDASITHSTGKRLDEITIGLVIVAIAVLVLDRFDLIPGTQRAEPTTEVASNASQAQEVHAATPPRFPPNSIAVLPFADMSAERDQEYLSDGLAEELLNLLAKIPQLQVAARTSAFSFKDKDTSIAEIAEALQVAHVLEGSVRKSGDRVRITAQLIRADNGYHLWSQTWDRDLEDIFAIQDEIAGQVVKELRIKLLGESPQVHETDPWAYALVLQGRHMRRQGSREAFQESERLIREALESAPDYEVAWIELANVKLGQGSRLLVPMDEAFEEARQYAEKALEINPESAGGYSALGYLDVHYRGDFVSGAKKIQKAFELAPGDAIIILDAAKVASALGRLNDALEIYRYGIGLDPANSSFHHNIAMILTALGRYEEAEQSARRAISLSPDSLATRAMLGEALLFGGRPEEALEAIGEEPDEIFRLAAHAQTYHALGRSAESDAALSELIEKHRRDAPYNIAQVYAFRGEADLAFEWLDLAVEYADPGLTELPQNAGFRSIHGDPRWMPFLVRIGRSPEQLAAIEFNVDLPQLRSAQSP